MAGFRTHITTSCGLGVVYGGAGLAVGLPIESCLLAGGMCGLAGMLPDLDSDSGVPFRETTAFVAAITPMLLVDRFHHMGFTVEEMALYGAIIYLAIRFGVFRLLKLYTVHRGMFHSIPALIIAGQIAFLLCTCSDLYLRFFKAGGVMLGFASHLFLDEIYSIDARRLRVKKSFGTAFKLFSPKLWPNVSAYGKLALLAWVINQDPMVREHWDANSGRWERFATAVQRLRNGYDDHDHGAPPHDTAKTGESGQGRGEALRSLAPEWSDGAPAETTTESPPARPPSRAERFLRRFNSVAAENSPGVR